MNNRAADAMILDIYRLLPPARPEGHRLMGENSKIEWTTHTFNPWVGCAKVSAACDHCYAESWAKRSGHPELWSGERRRTSEANWRQPLKWNAAAGALGTRPRVFCASLADVFDNQVPAEWRTDLWRLIRETPHLDWLLLTKRPQNIAKMLPGPITDRPWPWPNVWLGTTVENQEEADRRIPHLLAAPARVRFLSCEPLLGPVDLRNLRSGTFDAITGCGDFERLEEWGETPRIDWVIAGGESGPGARPAHPDWFRSLRDQCAAAGVPYFFKQWGEWSIVYDRDREDPDWHRCPKARDNRERYVNLVGGHGFHGDRVVFARRVGKKAAGRRLDGAEHNGFPT